MCGAVIDKVLEEGFHSGLGSFGLCREMHLVSNIAIILGVVKQYTHRK
jgi:hypothetical protein